MQIAKTATPTTQATVIIATCKPVKGGGVGIDIVVVGMEVRLATGMEAVVVGMEAEIGPVVGTALEVGLVVGTALEVGLVVGMELEVGLVVGMELEPVVIGMEV